jgi:butyryl-CoA dehydrogenase
MIDFQPTEDQELLQRGVAELAKATLAPRAREFEVARVVAADAASEARGVGLPGLLLPESAGGQAQGLTTAVLCEEELGAADAASAFVVSTTLHTLLSLELGAPESDLEGVADGAAIAAVAFSEERPCRERAGFSTTATKEGDEWVLTGAKAYVAHAAQAARLLVFAQAAPGWAGVRVFSVPAGAAGLSVGERTPTLGLDAVPYYPIRLEGVRVPASAERGAELSDPQRTLALVRAFTRWALVVGARAVGLSRTAWEMARDYADTRVAFGKPIGHFQAVAFTLADRLMDLDSARWLVQRGAAAFDALGAERDEKASRPALLAGARGAAHALEVAMRAADDCVQLHGGAGFIRDLLAEKLMRDAKQLSLSGPTPEHLDQLAAAVELGAPLDPALVLPTPDTQAIFT